MVEATHTPEICAVCGGTAVEPAGAVTGRFEPRVFTLRQCRACRFAWVANPLTDLAAVYSEAYYRGRGADPMVDYVFELEHPERTVRRYEWRGLMSVVSSLTAVNADTQWLDYGCGHGGLVRWARAHGLPHAVGYETGWIADTARAAGIPILTEDALPARDGTFDVVTAIEVLEHIPDPVAALTDMRRLLKPGGVLFVTTGNARPHRGRLPGWAYVVPEVHVSFFEPETLATAMRRAGFEVAFRGFLPGFEDIIRFKVLKNLHMRSPNLFERLVPWRVAARLIDARVSTSAHPVAVRPGASA